MIHSDTSSYEKFAQHVGIIGLADVALILRGLLLLPIIAKLLGPSGYGMWAQALVTLGLAAPIAEMGLSTALVRFLAPQKNKKEIREGFFSVFLVVLCSSLVIGLIIFLLSRFISSSLFGDTGATLIVQIVAAIVPFELMRIVCQSFFLAFRRIKTYSIFTLSQNFGEICLIAGLVFGGFGVFGAVLSLLVVRIISVGIALGMIISQIGIRLPDFHSLKAYLKFGLPLLPTNFFAWMAEASDRYVIGFFLGIIPVGVYSAAYSLGSFLGHFRVPLVRVLSPTLSKSYDEGKVIEVQSYLRYSLKYFLMLAIPAAIGLSLLGQQILRIFTTTEFVALGYLVIPFVALSMLIYGTYAITGAQILRLAKKTSVLGAIWGVAGLANLGLNLVLVPQFGILAAAATTLFCYALATGITLYFSSRQVTFKTDWIFILKSLVASGVMSLVVLGINPTGAWEVLLTIVLGVVVYGIVLFLLKGFGKSEVRFFTQLLRGTSK